ncbi:hypothetical protein QU593_07770 [Rossellomorea marisflavi]|uniref:hypothetical protein n=1 Tax=Rossellomorea marisflavi TaxID=189381 RepID=UPI0025B1E86A|nr:hypothetical protein [Rossellomorea marisflavi]WJV20324.1 hypothetical protein QU593_07770 [Rossellomorea marisflavi]
MKRLTVFVGVIILLYSVYYDLNKGTLTLLHEESVETAAPMKEPITPDVREVPYIETKVSTGDTVLSLVKDAVGGPLPVSVDQVIRDFEELNGIGASEIQAGKTYKFPKYPS